MYKKLIIFGAGANAADAYHFFGKEAIFCFVDNSQRLIGTRLGDKEIISSEALRQMVEKEPEDFARRFEVIVSVSKTRWAAFAIVSQLLAMGIEDYSIYMDIRRRWASGKDFLDRDRALYPHEQETILEIYKVQRDYLMRHADAAALLPATGALRKTQLDTARRADDFFRYLKKAGLNVSPFMSSGTLLGAVRHKGFIPWDDDLDFGLIYEEYARLVTHLRENSRLFVHRGNDVWETDEGERSCGPEYEYIGAYGLGYLQIYQNTGAGHVKENQFVTDIMPVYYFRDTYTQTDYKRDQSLWTSKREEDFDRVDRVWLGQAREQGVIVDHSGRVGWGHDFTSFLRTQWDLYGKRFDQKFWPEEWLFPMQPLKFEEYEWPAPADPAKWLGREGYGDPMSLPPRTGVYVHDKDRIFRERY